MLDTYPALDPSRVYVSGYSMGGAATFIVGAAHPELFAAMVPMAMYMGTMEDSEKEVFETLDIPFLLSTSSYDVAWFYDNAADHISDNTVGSLDLYMRANEIGSFAAEDADYDAYPYVGFPSDEHSERCSTVNTSTAPGCGTRRACLWWASPSPRAWSTPCIPNTAT